MKKILPLLVLAMFTLAGCHNAPASYEMADSPRQLIPNAEKFVNQVVKDSKHYKAEDWDEAIKQFVSMSKNYVEYGPQLTQDDRMKYNNIRMDFMSAVDATGNEDLALRVKEAYANVIGK